jgi:CDP-diacylglycerol--glycerol-3-phosphate 3-phosphatidyltransferase
MVSTLRVLAALNNQVLAAERWGKFKTVVQLSVIGLIFFIIDVKVLLPLSGGVLRACLEFLDVLLSKTPYWATVIAAAITIASGISYLKNNWLMLQKSWSLPVNE